MPPAVVKAVVEGSNIPLNTDPMAGSYIYCLVNRKSDYDPARAQYPWTVHEDPGLPGQTAPGSDQYRFAAHDPDPHRVLAKTSTLMTSRLCASR